MSNEQGKKSVKPLADILSVDLSSVNGLSAHPEQIDPEKEKKLKVISRVFNNAEDDILNGIQVIGSLMAHAGSYENYENIGVDEELLRDRGWFIKSLAETLRGKIKNFRRRNFRVQTVALKRLNFSKILVCSRFDDRRTKKAGS